MMNGKNTSVLTVLTNQDAVDSVSRDRKTN